MLFIDQTSNLTFFRNSFGSDNEVRLSDCTSVFKESDGSCFSTGECEGDCLPFDSRTCRVNLLSDSGTLTPTVTPTVFMPTPMPTTLVGRVVRGSIVRVFPFLRSVWFIVIAVAVFLSCCGVGVYVFADRRGERRRRRYAQKMAEVEAEGQPLVKPEEPTKVEEGGAPAAAKAAGASRSVDLSRDTVGDQDSSDGSDPEATSSDLGEAPVPDPPLVGEASDPDPPLVAPVEGEQEALVPVSGGDAIGSVETPKT
mmetsp:Transcript_13669/g.31771  ORF Transcript_13669/g.31771 Transcript_13669/m.31771 type:complete len:254 (+) Transcript_13669:991-1752(+)